MPVFTAHVDTPQRDKLLAATMTEEENAPASWLWNSLKFISLDGLYRGRGEAPRQGANNPNAAIIAMPVFSGDIPLAPSDIDRKGLPASKRRNRLQGAAPAQARPVNRSQPACQPASKAPPCHLRQGFADPRFDVLKPVLSGFSPPVKTCDTAPPGTSTLRRRTPRHNAERNPSA